MAKYTIVHLTRAGFTENTTIEADDFIYESDAPMVSFMNIDRERAYSLPVATIDSIEREGTVTKG